MEPKPPDYVTRTKRDARVPSDELMPPILALTANLAVGERRVFEVSDLVCICWVTVTASTSGLVHVQYGDACPEIPLPNTGGAGSNFHRLPSGVRRVILSNNGVSVSTIVAFYSAGRDFLMTFIQST